MNGGAPNNSMQRTALRTAADAERWQSMNTDNVIQALERLRRDYPLNHRRLVKSEMIHFSVEGIDEEFRASICADECIVSTKDWHEHFPTPEEMEAFLRCLFTGKAEIIVTYRGDKPVSHRTQIVGEETPQVVSRTEALFFPFWKPKTQKKKDYRIANHGLQPTRLPGRQPSG